MIINEDIVKWCKEYEGEKFHAVLCDPPYELGFMGKSWDSTGIAFNKETWRAISKHLYPGAHLLAFGGTRTFHRIAVAIEDAGFEIRDTVMWVYGSGFPKSHNLKGEYTGYGTALKPAWEPIIIARLPLNGTVAQNVQKYGSGALNIDGCRVGMDNDKELFGKAVDNYAGKNGGLNGIYGKSRQVRSVPPPQGRWPANLIHDGSDEVVGMFPNTKSVRSRRGELADIRGGNLVASNGKRIDGSDSERGYSDSGSAARFFYSAKVSKRERDAGLEGFEEKAVGTYAQDEWSRENMNSKPTFNKNTHPTLKPISLTTYLAKLILPPKLDQPRRLLVPFAGSGSEVIGGFKADWDEVVGIEQSKEYCEIAEARIKHWIK